MKNITNALKAKSGMSDNSINELFIHSSVLKLPKKHIFKYLKNISCFNCKFVLLKLSVK